MQNIAKLYYVGTSKLILFQWVSCYSSILDYRVVHKYNKPKD